MNTNKGGINNFNYNINYCIVIYVFVCLFLTSKTSYCQNKKNNFTFEIGAIYISPKQKEFYFKKEREYPHDYACDMKIYPKSNYGFNVNLGYSINLKTFEKIKLKIPIHIGFSNFKLQSNQVGEYYKGYDQKLFYGKIVTKTIYNTINLSTGIDFTHVNDKNNELEFNINFCLNLATKTLIDYTETPDDLVLNKVETEKGSFKDFSFLPSVNFKVARLFKIHSVFIGPFISINNYLLSYKQSPSLFISFNNTTYYNFLETGLKLKL